MPQSKVKDPKIQAYREYRDINHAAYAIYCRAKGTPFEARAKHVMQYAQHTFSEYQTDSDNVLQWQDRVQASPLMLFIGGIVSNDLDAEF